MYTQAAVPCPGRSLQFGPGFWGQDMIRSRRVVATQAVNSFPKQARHHVNVLPVANLQKHDSAPRRCVKQQAVPVQQPLLVETLPANLCATGLATTHADIHPLLKEAAFIGPLCKTLQQIPTYNKKLEALKQIPRIQTFMADPRNAMTVSIILDMSLQEQYVLLCLVAAGQTHVLQHEAGYSGDTPNTLHKVAGMLLRVEQFYDSMGGLLGYQHKSLQLIIAGTDALRQQAAVGLEVDGWSVLAESESFTKQEVTYHVPPALDLTSEDGRELAREAVAEGLRNMPYMAEIYPVGGAGDRLGLQCDVSGECLPAAMLPYCGRTMMEGLIRDLQAREYLYYRLTGKQLETPVAVMTSDAKGNHRRMSQLMEAFNWFGRSKQSFRLFRQPLVPVINTQTGEWLLDQQLQPMMKPGGHGAIWKLMKDEGIFDWLNARGCRAALVRQISNPMAGTDTTLLTLAGAGAERDAHFGFMSCDRHVGAAEGMQALQERKVWDGFRWVYDCGITNIEYTEFERLGITDQAMGHGSSQSVFPANTNVLYVGLAKAQEVVQQAISTGASEQLMPGLIFNLKKKVKYTDPLTKQQRQVLAGRMECTMQNIADYMTDRFDSPLCPREAARRSLSTFMVYNMRRKVTSSAKKKRDPTSTKIAQTPDGSFYDLQRNAWHLLQMCNVKHVPELGSIEQYLQKGPGFIFLYHPALGPLWEVISQKVHGGALMQGSELVLEVSEARLRDVTIDGSLLVYAENVMGHMESNFTMHGLQYGANGIEVSARMGNQHAMRYMNGQLRSKALMDASGDSNGNGCNSGGGGGSSSSSGGKLVYSSQCGRVHMTNMTVQNAGVDWKHPDNVFWKHQVTRREALRIVLHGQSEFEAHNVHIAGDRTFEVPDGYRMVVTQGPASALLDVSLTPLPSGKPTWEWTYSMDGQNVVVLDYRGPPVPVAHNPLPQPMLQPCPLQQDLTHYVLDYVI